MKKRKLALLATLIATASVMGACTQEEKPKDDAVYTITKEEPKKEVETKVDERIPALPTAQQMTEVMNTFGSYEEFQGKLLEVNVTEPEYTLENLVLAGNGVKEYQADVYFYKAKDGYFALYAKGDTILKDLPESIGMNQWSEAEAKQFIEDKSKS